MTLIPVVPDPHRSTAFAIPVLPRSAACCTAAVTGRPPYRTVVVKAGLKLDLFEQPLQRFLLIAKYPHPVAAIQSHCLGKEIVLQ